ncbi:MAG: hypothetical protein Q7T82_20315 [Armatimonadota bacterium]|nr:hypothetical protein [Armatimonadota bacterium]
MQPMGKTLSLLAYYLIWILAIYVGLGLLIGGAAEIVQMSFLDENWFSIAVIFVSLLVSVLVLRRRPSLKVLLWPLSIALALIVVQPLGFSIILTIGVGKLVIMAWGRRNVFAGSRLECRGIIARPRGIVEHTTYE